MAHRGIRSKQAQIQRNEKYKSFEQRKKEADTIRGIAKDLNQRDLYNGEIIFNKKNEASIQTAILTAQYCMEKEKPILSPNDKKRKKHDRVERTLFKIDLGVADKILVYEDGEVMNRAVIPCWWR